LTAIAAMLLILSFWYSRLPVVLLVDKVFPLEEIAAAHKYVSEGHKTGDVVITIESVDGDK